MLNRRPIYEFNIDLLGPITNNLLSWQVFHWFYILQLHSWSDWLEQLLKRPKVSFSAVGVDLAGGKGCRAYFSIQTTFIHFLFLSRPSLKVAAAIIGLLFYPLLKFLDRMLPLDIWGEAPMSQSAGVRNPYSCFAIGSAFAIIIASLLCFLVLIIESYGDDMSSSYCHSSWSSVLTSSVARVSPVSSA